MSIYYIYTFGSFFFYSGSSIFDTIQVGENSFIVVDDDDIFVFACFTLSNISM